MQSYEACIVGAGPAGSSCARALEQHGVDVLLLDKAEFPRDKTCAGWITPHTWRTLEIAPSEYATGRTLQPITSFRVGVLEGDTTHVNYPEPVSYGIRRCEFDHFLLQRCQCEKRLGYSVHSLQRTESRWIINQEIATNVLVGAGGNFCPVAREVLNQDIQTRFVRAQEVEFPSEVPANDHTPELLFTHDLQGYGWCFPKQNYVNIGLGHTDGKQAKQLAQTFFSRYRHLYQNFSSHRPHGHAYRLYDGKPDKLIEDYTLLIGDSAGLADPYSGEGIGPAIESGMAAAETILKAQGDYRKPQLAPYSQWVGSRFGRFQTQTGSGLLHTAQAILGRQLLRSRWFVRNVVLDRLFLHRFDPKSFAGSINRADILSRG